MVTQNQLYQRQFLSIAQPYVWVEAGGNKTENKAHAINCSNFSKVVSVTVSGGKLFHNFIADGKKECKWQSTLDRLGLV